MKIYLVRHGQTKWNTEGILQGTQDVLLNDLGIKQAKALNTYFKNIPFDVLCSSNLKRAFHTAEFLNKDLDKPIHIYEDLREIELGVWEGLTWKEVKEKYLKNIPQNPTEFLNVKAEGGESYQTFQTRSYNAIREIIKEYMGKEVVLLTHGGVIKAIVSKILNIDLVMRNLFDVDNASITILDYDMEKDTLKLVTLNELIRLT
ncbi:histidine phosphatase family protein [Liberiplasma polymorphum]|uniref:histidine phosphatase family protein n=1 Tax=Liberiplasma polymorphum TaxID=3374570 RepID=UPI0037726927